MLQWVIEHLDGRRLDRLVAEDIYSPLGLYDGGRSGLFFVDLDKDVPPGEYAATEQCPWRRMVLKGMVHDENAFAMGGVAGHAGLFGSAGAVHRLTRSLLRAYFGQSTAEVLPGALVRLFLTRQEQAGRTLGFDCPASRGASCGRHFDSSSVGHLGFTGTSLWIDLKRRISVILLTNRVHPSRENIAIRRFRPKLHDAVMAGMGCSPRIAAEGRK